MKIFRSKGKVVVVATDANDPNNCPRLIVSDERSSIKDDYHGRIRMSNKLLKKIV